MRISSQAFFAITMLLLLLSDLPIGTETFVVRSTLYLANKQDPPLMDIVLDIPVFDKQEEFTIDSERIAAFATNWRQWRGCPTLTDGDLLCYVSASVNCPFPYVFFSHVDRGGRFAIKNKMVFRNDLPYGISITNDSDITNIDDAILANIIYLYIDCRVNKATIEHLSIKCPKVKYINIVNCHDGENVVPLLEKLPLEYVHSMDIFGEADNNIIDLRNLNRVSVTQRVISSNTESIIRHIRLPFLKYIYLTGESDTYDWIEDMCPALEGVIYNGYLGDEVIKGIDYLSNRLRILHFRRFDDCITSEKGILLPNSIFNMRMLEHINLGKYRVPNGSKIICDNLKTIIADSNSDILEYISTIDCVELLSIREIIDVRHLLLLKKLRILEVEKINNDIVNPIALRIDELSVTYYGSSIASFEYLMQSCANGRAFFGVVNIKKSIVENTFNADNYPKELVINWQYDINEQMQTLINIYNKCKSVRICCPYMPVRKVVDEMEKISGLKFLVTGYGIRIPEKGITITFDERYMALYFAECIASDDYVYMWHSSSPIMDRSWLTMSVTNCTLRQCRQREKDEPIQ